MNMWQYGEYRQLIYLSEGTERTLTNKEILTHARALATGLKAQGIKKGDVVASVISNIPEIPEIVNGVTRTEESICPLSSCFRRQKYVISFRTRDAK